MVQFKTFCLDSKKGQAQNFVSLHSSIFPFLHWLRYSTVYSLILHDRAKTAYNDVIKQSDMRKCLNKEAFEMIQQEFKAQGRKYQLLPIILGHFAGSWWLKVPIFEHMHQ